MAIRVEDMKQCPYKANLRCSRKSEQACKKCKENKELIK